MASSDTIIMGNVPKGSFVINRDSAIANKEIIENMYKNKKKTKNYMGGGEVQQMQNYMGGGKVAPIKVGADEVIFSPEDVQQYGMGVMMALNQKPTAHENIDNLIVSSQLENMQGFKRGGYVTPSGTTMRRPRGGNPTSMMRYEDGGFISKHGSKLGGSLPAFKKFHDKSKSDSKLAQISDSGLGGAIGALYYNNPDAFTELFPSFFQENPTSMMGYEDGGSVDPRDLPTNTGANQGMISPFFGDTAPIPQAWMEPATEMVQTPEEAAAFQNQINMMLVAAALEKARQAGEQVQPEAIQMSNEEYSLQQLMPRIDKQMQDRIQLPLYQEQSPMPNLGRDMITR